MKPALREVTVQYSHFKGIPGVESPRTQQPPREIILNYSALLSAFKEMDSHELEETIPHFLDRMLAEARLIDVNNYMEEWELSDNDEKQTILSEIAYLKQKLIFFRSLILELRQQIIRGGTHAELDPDGTPQFFATINEFLEIINNYEQAVVAFDAFLAKQPRQ